MTRMRNFEDVRFGEYLIKTWYVPFLKVQSSLSVQASVFCQVLLALPVSFGRGFHPPCDRSVESADIQETPFAGDEAILCEWSSSK